MDVFTLLNQLGVDKIGTPLAKAMDAVNVLMPKDDDFSKFTSRKDFCMLSGLIAILAVQSYPYKFQEESMIKDIISKTQDVQKILTGSDGLFMAIHASKFQAYALAVAAIYQGLK